MRERERGLGQGRGPGREAVAWPDPHEREYFKEGRSSWGVCAGACVYVCECETVRLEIAKERQP